MPVFKTGAINHSATSPQLLQFYYSKRLSHEIGKYFPSFLAAKRTPRDNTAVFKAARFDRSRIAPAFTGSLANDDICGGSFLPQATGDLMVFAWCATRRRLLRHHQIVGHGERSGDAPRAHPGDVLVGVAIHDPFEGHISVLHHNPNRFDDR